MALSSLPEDFVVVDCAACRCLALVDPLPVPKGFRVKAFGGRVRGRPYCVDCLLYPEGSPDDRSKSSDFRRSSGQFEKLRKELFS